MSRPHAQLAESLGSVQRRSDWFRNDYPLILDTIRHEMEVAEDRAANPCSTSEYSSTSVSLDWMQVDGMTFFPVTILSTFSPLLFSFRFCIVFDHVYFHVLKMASLFIYSLVFIVLRCIFVSCDSYCSVVLLEVCNSSLCVCSGRGRGKGNFSSHRIFDA